MKEKEINYKIYKVSFEYLEFDSRYSYYAKAIYKRKKRVFKFYFANNNSYIQMLTDFGWISIAETDDIIDFNNMIIGTILSSHTKTYAEKKFKENMNMFFEGCKNFVDFLYA